MFIYVVPEEVIWTVNWLHYLNYEPIESTSSNRYLVSTRNILGQMSHHMDGVTSFHMPFLSLDCSQNDSRLTVFITKGKRVFHLSIMSLVSLRNGYASGRLSYVQAFMYHPCHTHYVTVLVFVCPYVCTPLVLRYYSHMNLNLFILLSLYNILRFEWANRKESILMGVEGLIKNINDTVSYYISLIWTKFPLC